LESLPKHYFPKLMRLGDRLKTS